MKQLIKTTIIAMEKGESESIKEGRETEKGAKGRIKGEATGEGKGKKEKEKVGNGEAISGKIARRWMTVIILTMTAILKIETSKGEGEKEGLSAITTISCTSKMRRAFLVLVKRKLLLQLRTLKANLKR